MVAASDESRHRATSYRWVVADGAADRRRDVASHRSVPKQRRQIGQNLIGLWFKTTAQSRQAVGAGFAQEKNEIARRRESVVTARSTAPGRDFAQAAPRAALVWPPDDRPTTRRHHAVIRFHPGRAAAPAASWCAKASAHRGLRLINHTEQRSWRLRSSSVSEKIQIGLGRIVENQRSRNDSGAVR